MNQYKAMTNEYLKKTYVPDVYQKSIFNIDYDQLKNSGIKLISFDIDDTIVPIEKHNPTKAVITLFEKLKRMGLELVLISNANDNRVQRFGEEFNIEYISKASKPHVDSLEAVRQMYINKYETEIHPKEMAHIGNSMIKDIATGNAFGVTTCLVRNVGYLPKTGKVLNPFKTEGQKLRKELLERGIWRKHHLKEKGDQYYQMGETPKYRQ